jgi:hypothetical protein
MEKDMAAKEPSSDGAAANEIAETLHRRTGLRLTQEQIASLNDSIRDVDAIAARVRKGLTPEDEPAFVFRVPR